MIDFTLSPQQLALQSHARAFASTHLSTAAATYDHLPDQAARFRATRPIYRAAVSAGLISGQIPAPLGGTGGSLVDAAILVEELYAVEASASLTILGTGLGLTPLLLAGSAEQHARLLAPFLSGQGEPFASLVHSEPGGTANWLEKGGRGLQTTARREGDEWVITGEKLWTTNSAGWDGRGAELQCVVCRYVQDGGPQDPAQDPKDAICIVMVTREDIARNREEAYTVLGDPELAGHRAASGPHTRFTNLRVPAANLLAAPGHGAAVIEQTFGSSAAIVGAMSVGIMRAAFEAALAYAKTQTRGGSVPILERQSVADLLIDVKMRCEASRYLTWKALHGLENGPGGFAARLEMALEAKVFASDNAVKCVVDGMKVVGMSAYAKDQPFSRLLNDAACLPLFDGGNVGIRRRQIERIFLAEEYEPWAASYGV
ncbi:hypothetical protein B0A49_08254 [Cryomyces minteri]|uniref:Nitroalkane oxidase n=1 Tax=Cryomyces minteri TaxID=331657 RepID=A0A4U0WV05_9PEZI|nr:hypothetical protein B0A49_08254 [Cryomyces minteri]